MKSGDGGLGSRREGVVGDVGVCDDADGLRGAALCWGVFAPELLLLSDRSMGLALPAALVPGVLGLLPVPGVVAGLVCGPEPARVPFRLRKW